MSILSKVLVILNILAAGAFIYLATADWGQRETWSYAVYRHDLALNGLPLDETELDTDGGRAVDRLSDQTFQAILQPVGGGPAGTLLPEDKTQLAEVRRVRQRLLGEIASLGDNLNQVKERMIAWLVPMARTGGERDAIRLGIDKAANISQLTDNESTFEKAFRAVLDPGQSPPESRRAEVAHLLLNMTVDPGSANDFARQYQRVLVVVGLKEFANAADRQYYALRDMAERVSQFMAEDQAGFERDYELTLKYLYSKAEDLGQIQKKLADYQKVTKQHQDLVSARKRDLEDLANRLDDARKATQQALANLTAEQQRLFEAERNVASSAEKNQQLERELRVLEKVQP
jgi:hypothetical protein